MRNPQNVLESLRAKASDKNYTYKRLYRNLYNREMYLEAYGHIYAKEGNMTEGTDGKTIDGMSIARAIIEYTNGKKIGAKTLFATHYHELTSMEEEFDGIVNYNIAAKKRGDNITFLRKIVRGSTDDSYGIEVAKLAGIPNEVIKRAREVLASVERTAKAIGESNATQKEVDDSLISIDDFVNEQIIEELRAVDINTLSPYEAMSFLFDLKKRLR